MRVAVLCTRKGGVYQTLPVDAYDAARDARTYTGPAPVIAHPPCAQWGRLRTFSNDDPGLKALGPFCVEQVRRWGGVLEHPCSSSLWPACGLPLPGGFDEFGGFTLAVSQSWFGHRAEKFTWLYFCGIRPGELAPMPPPILRGSFPVARMGRAEREATPHAMAQWLIACASRAGRPGQLDVAINRGELAMSPIAA